MPASITKADGSGTPIGTLATYSISKSNIPTNPADSSGQVPTFSATIVNAPKDNKRYLGDSVVLTDLDNEPSEGVVVSVSRAAKSGMIQLDMNTVFERLNTEQTTYPVYTDSSFDTNMSATAIEQWLLMAGIPRLRLPGNLLHYVSNQSVGFSSRTEPTWVIAPVASWPANHSRYLPNYGTDLGRLDVNRAQSLILGMPIYAWEHTGSGVTTEVLVNTFVSSLNTKVTYRLLQVARDISFQQKVGTAAYTTLATMTIPLDITVSGDAFLYLNVKAHPTVTANVSVAMRVIAHKTDTGLPVAYDSTVASVASHLRKRPAIQSIDLGWDNTQIASYMSPYMFFISEGSDMPFDLPHEQILFDIDVVSSKSVTAVPGFTGNVWEKLKQYCAIHEIDITFNNDKIVFKSRKAHRVTDFTNEYIPMAPRAKANIVEGASQRDKSRAVEVVYRDQPKQNLTGYLNGELWRADSVYTLEKGETLVELVQTESTFVTLNQPVPVSGVPVPYTLFYGSYVITGHDGWIVDPQWWTDNGGSIKVTPTGQSGEIRITMQAPNVDTVRAPYRVSEGVADRPALYIFGEGLKLGKPKTVKVYTGNPDAAEDVGTKFESEFITNKLQAFNVGHRLAITYGAGDSTVSLDLPRKENKEEQYVYDLKYPAAIADPNFYFNRSAYRIEQYTIGLSAVSVSKAVRFNTHRIINGEYATGQTIAQQNAAQAGMKIKDINLAPLPEYLS